MTITAAAQPPTRTRARLRAPAKINLTLDVLGRRGTGLLAGRPDGFHDLCSLAVGVGLADELACESRAEPGVLFECDNDDLRGPGNLVYRAAELLASRCAVRRGARLRLRKATPVGAGMGGGSSDAAAALWLCNDVWGTGLDDAELAALGAELGSDVPLFFALPSGIIRGRGERVEPVQMAWNGWVLLVFAGVPVPTEQVYAARRPSDGDDRTSGAAQAATRAKTAAELSSLLSNHLEPAVFRVAARVRDVYEQLVHLGFGTVRVSGAGSALYVLYDDEHEARQAADRVNRRNIGVTTLVVPVPVPYPCIVREDCVHGDF